MVSFKTLNIRTQSCALATYSGVVSIAISRLFSWSTSAFLENSCVGRMPSCTAQTHRRQQSPRLTSMGTALSTRQQEEQFEQLAQLGVYGQKKKELKGRRPRQPRAVWHLATCQPSKLVSLSIFYEDSQGLIGFYDSQGLAQGL